MHVKGSDSKAIAGSRGTPALFLRKPALLVQTFRRPLTVIRFECPFRPSKTYETHKLSTYT